MSGLNEGKGLWLVLRELAIAEKCSSWWVWATKTMKHLQDV